MKASTLISIILAILALVFSVLWFTTNMSKSKLKKQNESLTSSFESATSTINEIQANLDSIESGLGGQLFSSKETPLNAEDRRSQIINSIRNMKTQIDSDKQRIAELEKRLANSTYKIKGLEELVAKLKASVAAKEKIVAELSGKLGVMEETLFAEKLLTQEQIGLRDQEIADKAAVIAEQEKDINTIFYIYGTRKELTEKNIINREGGILGIGKVSTLDKTNELAKYKSFDLKEVDGISFPASRRGYSILSNQNAASYRVDKVGDSYILKVTDKETFRKNKLLIIEIL